MNCLEEWQKLEIFHFENVKILSLITLMVFNFSGKGVSGLLSCARTRGNRNTNKPQFITTKLHHVFFSIFLFASKPQCNVCSNFSFIFGLFIRNCDSKEKKRMQIINKAGQKSSSVCWRYSNHPHIFTGHWIGYTCDVAIPRSADTNEKPLCIQVNYIKRNKNSTLANHTHKIGICRAFVFAKPEQGKNRKQETEGKRSEKLT